MFKCLRVAEVFLIFRMLCFVDNIAGEATCVHRPVTWPFLYRCMAHQSLAFRLRCSLLSLVAPRRAVRRARSQRSSRRAESHRSLPPLWASYNGRYRQDRHRRRARWIRPRKREQQRGARWRRVRDPRYRARVLRKFPEIILHPRQFNANYFAPIIPTFILIGESFQSLRERSGQEQKQTPI